MDDLEFRRQVYASPKQHSKEIKQAILADSNKRQFADDMHNFENQLEQALKISVPDDLAGKIILKQSIDKHKQSEKRKNRWYLAVAASIAFMIGLTINSVYLTPFNTQQPQDLANLMLKHAEQDMLHHFASANATQTSQVSLNTINQKLSSYGASLTDSFAIVRSVNFCQMKNVRALHLIVQGENGLVNIFVMHTIPNIQNLPQINGELFKGQGKRLPKADLMYIGTQTENLNQIQQKFENSLKWRA
ncbi:DUF3379 domain-containing protein [Catenovulum sp. 2E275]|uniref:DUF3379 domain-containing protein n=1 Tax=Catenovulum sp. 2E275 TaxID=2980497 RepID=UPI0021CE13E5|nr:DUF3379 domain-containing protein [Catenovulum sp. 2E275]MCU4677690.1 DUF3379 domain-containing protein [Catenovulum sp. 2E275]